MRYLIVYILVVMLGMWGMADADASEYKLIVPLATTHINTPYYYPELEEQNKGIGIEYVENNYMYSLMYLKNNSFGKPSFYATVSRKAQLTNDFSMSAGLMVATGYHTVWEDPTKNQDKALIGSPVLSVQWKCLRLVTSYPFGTLSNADHADFVNLQYVRTF